MTSKWSASGYWLFVGQNLESEILLKSSFWRVYIIGITYLMCLVTILESVHHRHYIFYVFGDLFGDLSRS